MSAKGLLARIFAVYLLAVTCFLLLAAADAEGTPIRPDVKRMVEEVRRPRPAFIPSRVGWNGPEMRTSKAGGSNRDAAVAPVLAAERERRLRATLQEVAIPEPRALFAIAGLIVLLRKLRSLREQQQEMLTRQPQTA